MSACKRFYLLFLLFIVVVSGTLGVGVAQGVAAAVVVLVVVVALVVVPVVVVVIAVVAIFIVPCGINTAVVV